MKFPGYSNALVSKEKICEYLLSLSHPIGGTKARFFRGFGFVPERWEEFSHALKDIAQKSEVKETSDTPFGKRYVVDGVLKSPDQRNPLIRTVWFIPYEEKIPHLVTAFPFPPLKEVK